jgi:hypothetical protein
MTKGTFCVKKDDDGVVRQKFMQAGWWKPSELKRHLDQPSQAKKIKEHYDIIIATELALQPCALRCKGCAQLVSPVEPRQTTKQHNSSCKSKPRGEEVEKLEDEDEEEQAGKRGSQSSLVRFMPNAQQQQAVHSNLLRGIITGDVPFKFMNNEFVRMDHFENKLAGFSAHAVWCYL